jgi:hypothetical protein
MTGGPCDPGRRTTGRRRRRPTRPPGIAKRRRPSTAASPQGVRRHWRGVELGDRGDPARMCSQEQMPTASRECQPEAAPRTAEPSTRASSKAGMNGSGGRTCARRGGLFEEPGLDAGGGRRVLDRRLGGLDQVQGPAEPLQDDLLDRVERPDAPRGPRSTRAGGRRPDRSPRRRPLHQGHARQHLATRAARQEGGLVGVELPGSTGGRSVEGVSLPRLDQSR